jgi:hypothetical protein
MFIYQIKLSITQAMPADRIFIEPVYFERNSRSDQPAWIDADAPLFQ